jgi:excisionase family DNA binding protein
MVSQSAFTLEETAVHLRCSVKTLRRMAARKELRLVRLGRALRVPVSELKRLLGELPTPVPG